jgi:hypothetical protein
MEMEMVKRGKTAKRQLQRIAALPVNHLFEGQAKRIREAFKIPADGKDAHTWFLNHLGPYKKGITLRRWSKFRRKRQNISEFIDTEVPLEQRLLVLMDDFGIPFTMFFPVMKYVASGEKKYLQTNVVYHLTPDLTLHADRGEYELTITVDNVGIWTTKKDWEALWDDYVKDELKELKRFILDGEGVKVAGTKASLKYYRKQMERWSEWYQLSELQGYGPKKALELWEEKYPKQRGKYDLSTVTKAVRDFRQIITPQPI